MPHTARLVKKLISAETVTFSDMAVAIDSFVSPQVREFEFGNPRNFWLGNPQSRKFCLWNSESRALEYGILLTIGIQNPSSNDQDGLESSTWIQNLRRGIQNPRLDSLQGRCVDLNWRHVTMVAKFLMTTKGSLGNNYGGGNENSKKRQ